MRSRLDPQQVDEREKRDAPKLWSETVAYFAMRVLVWLVVAALCAAPVLAILVKNSFVELPASLLPTLSEASLVVLSVLLLLSALSVYTTFLMLHEEPYSFLWLPAFFGAVGTTVYMAYVLLDRLVF